MNEPQFDIRALVGLLRRHLRLILVTIVTVVSLSALYVFTQTPIFTANTLVLVDPRQKNLLDPEMETASGTADNARVESEVEILQSPSTLLAVVNEQGLIADPEFGVSLGLKDRFAALVGIKPDPVVDGGDQLQRVLDRFSRTVSISRRRTTYLIAIGVSSADPDKAARLANALASSYIAQQLRAKVAYTVTARDALRQRLSHAASDINAAEARIDQFVSTNAQLMESGSADVAALRSRLEVLAKQSAASVDLVGNLDALAAGADWTSLSAKLESDAVRQLAAEREALAARFAETTSGSAASVDLRMQLDRLDRELATTVNTEVDKLRRQTEATQAEEEKLREQLRAALMASNLPNDVLVRLYQLQQEADVSRSQYQEILQRLRQVEAEADLQVPDSRIVSAATPPTNPTSPRIGFLLGVSALAATGFGVALAFLMENYIGGFSSTDQVEAVVGLPALAAIPAIPGQTKTRGRSAIADEILNNPLSAFSEAVRMARLGVENRLPALSERPSDPQAPRKGVVIMLASALPGEGKTTTAVSLARSFSFTGRSTLMIDCDLRRPAVSNTLDIDGDLGLIDFLTDAASPPSLSHLIMNDRKSDLRVIPGGRRSTVPTDTLLASERFRTLVDVARQRFDVVVLDTPPLLLVNDTQYLAKLADMVVFTIRWSATSQREVQAALHVLASCAPATVERAVILNQSDSVAVDYGRRYAGYYSLGPA